MTMETKMTKLMMMVGAGLVLCLLASEARAGQAVLPYGTYLVKGAFKDDYNTVLRGGVAAKVRLLRPDGTVIAEAPVTGADDEGVNFLLQVPVALASTESACMVGEVLDCAFVTEEEGTILVPAALKVGSPLKPGRISVNCTAVKSFANPRDGSVVEIPEAYIAEVQSYLKEGETYDPWKDYDGDGSVNFEEFKNGTNPFDATDRLRIIAFAPKDGQFALTFEHVGGHVYAVSSADMLARPEWTRRRVRRSAAGEELGQVLAAGESGEPGSTEIFITPVAGATSEFFKVEAE